MMLFNMKLVTCFKYSSLNRKKTNLFQKESGERIKNTNNSCSAMLKGSVKSIEVDIYMLDVYVNACKH